MEHADLEDLPQRYEPNWPLADLTPHPHNPNVGDLAAIEESMDENGWYGAIIVQESTGYVIAGNHRKLLRELKGRDTGPVIFVECDDETATRILLADNETTRRGHVDNERLDLLLASLAELPAGLRGTGYSLEDLQAEVDLDEVEADDDIPDDSDFVTNYGVIVVCQDEREQEQAFRKLKEFWPDREVRVVAG